MPLIHQKYKLSNVYCKVVGFDFCINKPSFRLIICINKHSYMYSNVLFLDTRSVLTQNKLRISNHEIQVYIHVREKMIVNRKSCRSHFNILHYYKKDRLNKFSYLANRILFLFDFVPTRHAHWKSQHSKQLISLLYFDSLFVV